MKWELPAMRIMANNFGSVPSIMLNDALDEIERLDKRLEKVSEKSDGYHTFGELYDHRIILFALLCKENRDISWKSTLHSDGSRITGWFVAGMDLPSGQITYHIPLRNWDKFDVNVLEKAPAWDGHSSADVLKRLQDWLE